MQRRAAAAARRVGRSGARFRLQLETNPVALMVQLVCPRRVNGEKWARRETAA